MSEFTVHGLMTLATHKRHRLLADRLNAARLWAFEDLFGEAFAEAAAHVFRGGDILGLGDGAGAYSDARRFVENTFVNLITRPGDLVALCRRLPSESLRSVVAESYVRHPLVSQDILAAMGGCAEVHRELPAGGWTEVPVCLYASRRLADEPTRQFELHELFPFGTDLDRHAAWSGLRAALEANQLTDAGRGAAGPSARPEIPAPVYYEGQYVQVVANGRNRTLHRGMIRDKIWHYKDAQWYYFLRDDSGRKVAKRYSSADLRPAGLDTIEDH